MCIRDSSAPGEDALPELGAVPGGLLEGPADGSRSSAPTKRPWPASRRAERSGGSSSTELTPPTGSSRSLERSVSYTHLRAHETPEHLVCHLLLEKKKKKITKHKILSPMIQEKTIIKSNNKDN